MGNKTGRKPKSQEEKRMDSIFGAAVSRLRESRGYSVAQVADAMGLSSSMIEKIEAGTRGPSFYQALQFSKLFHLSIEEIIRGHSIQHGAGGKIPKIRLDFPH